jgi:hypothetical protein
MCRLSSERRDPVEELLFAVGLEAANHVRGHVDLALNVEVLVKQREIPGDQRFVIDDVGQAEHATRTEHTTNFGDERTQIRIAMRRLDVQHHVGRRIGQWNRAGVAVAERDLRVERAADLDLLAAAIDRDVRARRVVTDQGGGAATASRSDFDDITSFEPDRSERLRVEVEIALEPFKVTAQCDGSGALFRRRVVAKVEERQTPNRLL